MASIFDQLKKNIDEKRKRDALAEALELTKEEAESKLEFIEALPKISVEQYLEEQLYLIPNEAVGKVRKKISLELASEIYKISFGQAYEKMNAAKTNYGISYAQFIEHNLMDCSSEEKFQKVARQIKAKERESVRDVIKATGWSEEKALEEMNRVKETFDFGFRGYYDGQLFLCSDAEIKEKADQKEAAKKENIQTVIDATGWSKRSVRKHMYKCRWFYGINATYYMVFKCWELTDEEIDGYARARFSKMLSDKYNIKLGDVLRDKLLFNQTYKDYIKRKFWINRDTSFEEFASFAEGLTELFCKPVNLSGGKGMEIVKIEGDLHSLYDQLMARETILVEECIEQHSAMSAIFPGCVNTVRVFTLQVNDQCHRLCSFVRFGCYGVTDNFGKGGILAAVDVETGEVITNAIDKKGNWYTQHPITGKPILGFTIPHWDLVKEITENALRSQENVNYVGWDVAICPDKVSIIEGNAWADLGAYQSAFSDTKKGQRYLVDPYL